MSVAPLRLWSFFLSHETGSHHALDLSAIPLVLAICTNMESAARCCFRAPSASTSGPEEGRAAPHVHGVFLRKRARRLRRMEGSSSWLFFLALLPAQSSPSCSNVSLPPTRGPAARATPATFLSSCWILPFGVSHHRTLACRIPHLFNPFGLNAFWPQPTSFCFSVVFSSILSRNRRVWCDHGCCRPSLTFRSHGKPRW